MEYIPFPFPKQDELKITFDGKTISCTAELADTIPTIYQALNYRSKEEFTQPLVLLFSDPITPHSVWFNFPFAVELIEVSNWSRYGFQPAQNYPGTFVKNYVGLKALVLLPEGFFQQHGFTPSHMPFGPPQSTYIRPRVKCQLKKYGKYFPHGPQLL
jgi:hypothetical protein